MASRYAPIGEYGVIGDLYTVALVGMDGSIDFLCLPHFDSPSVFAALVDAERGGRFQIAPLLEGAARKQLYLPDTNVLLTRFSMLTASPSCPTSCPWKTRGQAHNLVRRAKTVRARCASRCAAIRASTMRAPPTRPSVGRHRGALLRAVRRRRAGAAPAIVRPDASRERRGAGRFHAGRRHLGLVRLEVVLAQEPSPSEQPDYESDAFKQTVNFWRRWVARSTYGAAGARW